MVYGFSPSARSSGSSARAAADARAASGTAGRARQGRYVLGGAEPGPAAEDDQVRQRVAAEPVGPVHAAGHLADREQAGHRGGAGVRVHLDPAHHVVGGRPDLHRLLGDVHVGQLLELVIHGRQPLQDVFGRPPGRDIQEDPAVRRPAARLDLGVDRAGHLVAGEQLRRAPVVVRVVVPAVRLFLGLGVLGPEHVGHVVEHEPLALGVAQHAAVAAHRLGDQQPAHRGRPDHPGRVQLDELHVQQLGPGAQRQRVAVAGVLPRVGRDLVGLADAAGGQHHRGRLEQHEPAGVPEVPEGSGDPRHRRP